eukprot:CAMPEP_0170514202 /NCGR_PEP_ID=MMETSP0209-20121228/759_1 /TAXON_ID=665100 ORGANISM="Litonotus pictus, Strain P1" /NCGR_SAMPLE_ID=MMETSP0209 /ASSEMBLY_ACC=CAM_ASM_000301 /LENGTH=368 /DNA_ID=CAMNT_0010798195 /DNA_START=338 /DNA_END=1444 /DNA_ORIENTATION=+
MGANLVHGTVTQNNCIACPFHNWTFDGKSGTCLSGKKQKQASKFKYQVSKNHEGNTIYNFIEAKPEDMKCKTKSTKISIEEENDTSVTSNGDDCADSPNIKSYVIYENAGIIYIFLHAIREKELNPDYYPFDLTEEKKKFVYRGTATNKTKNQFQDMPENGADIAHFLYIHPQIFKGILYAYWKPKWVSASAPDLLEQTKSDHSWITDFRHKLINKFVNDSNKSKIGIVLLENEISFFNFKYRYLFFGLIGFQVGPGLVYLFLKSPFFETMFFQYSELIGKHNIELHHEIWTANWIPYWFSALKLKLESDQVTNDCVIWDNKKFGSTPWYNLSTVADNFLKEWRVFFCQFYEGCKEKDEKLKALNSDW